MADLDNFFAKKDKKKKKGFSKANADIIIKNIEESERRSEQKAAAEEKAGGLATSEATKAALNNDHDGNKAEKAAASSASTGTGTSSSSNPSVSGNEPVLATTDAARQAHKMFGLSDDGTVKGRISERALTEIERERLIPFCYVATAFWSARQSLRTASTSCVPFPIYGTILLHTVLNFGFAMQQHLSRYLHMGDDDIVHRHFPQL